MSFDRKQQILAPGGLNLLASSDLVPGTDSIAMKNFRSDGSGVLRTRLSNSAIGVTLTGYIHTIYRSGNDRYFGANTTLYQGSTAVSMTGAFDGGPISMATVLGKVWVMNRSKRGVVNTVGGIPTLQDWLPVPPVLFTITPQTVTGSSLVTAVTYTYYVTYVQEDGSETNPSDPISYTMAGTENQLHIECISAPDPRSTKWNLYRIGNTLDAVYRVNPDPISIGDAFEDSGGDDMSDFNVTLLGIQLETHHDPAPMARVIAGPYYGRMLAASSAEFPNRIWWTPVNQPWYWPRENYVDIGDRADEVYAIALHTAQARFYGKRSISRLNGDPASGIIGRTNAEIGLIGMRAIDSAGSIDFFQGMEGIYSNDGDTTRKIGGDKLDPLFRPLSMPRGADPDLLPLNGTETLRAKNCLAFKNGRLYFSYVNSAGTVPNQMTVCNLAASDWTAENAPSPSQPASYTALYYEGQASELLGAGPLGIIYALEYPLPETNVIPHRWTSGFFSPGARDQKARFADLVLEHDCKRSAAFARNLTCKLKLDDTDTADFAAGSLPVATTGTGAARLVTVLPLGANGKGLHARNAAVLVEGDCEHEISLYSATLHYYLEPRDALLFDSSATLLGDPRVKSCDLLDLVIWNQGTVTWEILTDLPGNAMTQRATGTFAAVTDRTPVPLSLAGLGCEGRLIQVRLTSSLPFWLYRAALRYYVINYYLSDSNKTLMLPAVALNI